MQEYIFAAMSQPLRITYKGRDYSYKVLTRKISKDTRSIRIEMEGQEFELSPDQRNQWHATDATITDPADLLNFIARNVALRYRL